MRSSTKTSSKRATRSTRYASFYDATFSTAKSFDHLARNNCVFDWTRRSAAEGETVHQPPVAMPDCIRPPGWLQHWNPLSPRRA